jgi:hypothetical protein
MVRHTVQYTSIGSSGLIILVKAAMAAVAELPIEIA